MGQIALPTSVSQQGFAFEHLILSYYQKNHQFRVRESSPTAQVLYVGLGFYAAPA